MKSTPSLLFVIVLGLILSATSPQKSGADEFYKGFARGVA